jgi:hypothetical protein
MYFCKADDLNAEIDHLGEASFVQLRVPRDVPEVMTLEQLNDWLDEGVARSTGAGVRAIMTIVHAMFVRGEPDAFRSLSGGDFDKIDRHLQHVRRVHPHVKFATATEAVLEFLDYYTPEPRAVVTTPTAQGLDGSSALYDIRILGRGIPLDESHTHLLEVSAPPAFDIDELTELRVLDQGSVIATAAPRGDRISTITFRASKRRGYQLELLTRAVPAKLADPIIAPRPELWSTESVRYEQPPEPEQSELFRLLQPAVLRKEAQGEGLAVGDVWEWLYPIDLFRLLVHPLAGAGDPLGRRLHPYGRILEGMGVHAAMAMTGFHRPVEATVRWTAPVEGKSDFRLRSEVTAVGQATTIHHLIDEGAITVGEVVVKFGTPVES